MYVVVCVCYHMYVCYSVCKLSDVCNVCMLMCVSYQMYVMYVCWSVGKL